MIFGNIFWFQSLQCEGFWLQYTCLWLIGCSFLMLIFRPPRHSLRSSIQYSFYLLQLQCCFYGMGKNSRLIWSWITDSLLHCLVPLFLTGEYLPCLVPLFLTGEYLPPKLIRESPYILYFCRVHFHELSTMWSSSD